MSSLNPRVRSEDEETIDLGKYLKVIIKRKAVLLWIVLIFAIAGLLIAFIIPKSYESVVAVRIGFISKQLITKPEAIQFIESKEIQEQVLNDLRLDPKKYNIKKMLSIIDVPETSLIKIRIRASDPEISKNICNAISNIFVSGGNDKFRKQVSFINEELGDFEKKLENIETSIGTFNKSIGSKEWSLNYPLLQNVVSSYEQAWLTLKEKIFFLKGQLLDSYDFKVFDFRNSFNGSLLSGLKQTMPKAVIFGLFLGILVVFLQERRLNSK